MLDRFADVTPPCEATSLYALTQTLERRLRATLSDAAAADLHALQPAVAAYCRAALRAGHAFEFVRHGATHAMSAAMRPGTPMLRRVDVALAVSRFVEAAVRTHRLRTGASLADTMRPRMARHAS